jgi:aspartyl/asparaginyl beta-hydroxylase (cupin superfamily)
MGNAAFGELQEKNEVQPHANYYEKSFEDNLGIF